MIQFDLDEMRNYLEIVRDVNLLPSSFSIYEALGVTKDNLEQRTCLMHALINQRAYLDLLIYPREMHGRYCFFRVYIEDEGVSILVSYNISTDKLIVVELQR